MTASRLSLFLFAFLFLSGLSFAEMLFLRLKGLQPEWGILSTATIGLATATGLLAVALSLVLRERRALTVSLTVPVALFARHGLIVLSREGIGVLQNPVVRIVLALVASAVFCHLVTPLAARRDVRRALAAVALIGLIGSFQTRDRPPPVAAVPGDDRPDVLLLVMDTTRQDRLSHYGYPPPTTPRLDAFARGAHVYENAWSVAPWTTSSHASMYTGLLPSEHGVDGPAEGRLPPGVATLPELLQRAGYATAGFPANPSLASFGWDRGFEVYRVPWIRGLHTLGNLLNRARYGSGNGWRARGGADRVLGSAKDWWEREADRPRFLFVNLIEPTSPTSRPRGTWVVFSGTSRRRTPARWSSPDAVPSRRATFFFRRPGLAGALRRGDASARSGDREVLAMARRS